MDLEQAEKQLGFDGITQETIDALNESKRRVLDVLADNEWHSNLDIVNVVGNTEAIRRIRELSAEGFEIEKDGHQRNWSYRWTGKIQPMERVSKKLQEAYYQTNHWRRVSAERKRFDGHRCCHCKSPHELVVHHLFYDLFNEQQDDLITLCKRHHEVMHAAARFAFPKLVKPQIADRLRRESQVKQETAFEEVGEFLF